MRIFPYFAFLFRGFGVMKKAYRFVDCQKFKTFDFLQKSGETDRFPLFPLQKPISDNYVIFIINIKI